MVEAQAGPNKYLLLKNLALEIDIIAVLGA